MKLHAANAIAIVGCSLSAVGLFDESRRYLMQIGALLMISALYLTPRPI